MSLHNKPEYNDPNCLAAMRKHNLKTDEPSQLSDAFRIGWYACRQNLLIAKIDNRRCHNSDD